MTKQSKVSKPKPVVISRGVYLRALALFTMANRHYLAARKFEDEMHTALGLESNTGTWFSDCVFVAGANFDKALAKENFVVRKQAGGAP